MINRLPKLCDKLAWGMFCILMADVCIFGAGKLVSVGSLSFRMILLVLTSLVCLPVILQNFTVILKSKYTWAVAGFGIWLLLATVVGIRNGNDRSLLITDWKGFLYFLLFPTAICLIRNRQRAQRLTKIMVYAAGIMAVIHILCILCYLWRPELLDKIGAYSKSVHFFYISYKVSEMNVRINFLSLVCQLFGCAFSVYYQLKETKFWKRCVYVLITALCLFAIWLSYTRSIYLAAGMAAICTVITLLIRSDKTARKRIALHLCSSIALFFVIVAAFRIGTGTNYFFYGLSRSLLSVGIDSPVASAPVDPTLSGTTPEATLPPATTPEATLPPATTPEATLPPATTPEATLPPATTPEATLPPATTPEATLPPATTPVDTTPFESPDATTAPGGNIDNFHSDTFSSDKLRAATVKDLTTLIKTSPVWGHGLGAEIPSRPDGLNEYFFLDLTAKTGFVGLILYLLPVALMLWGLLQKLRKRTEDFAFNGLWLVVILGFVLYSYFTPCMNSSVGIMCYCCAMAVFQQASATKNNV